MIKLNKKRFNRFVGKNSIFKCEWDENVYYNKATNKIYKRTKRLYLTPTMMLIPLLYIITLVENLIKAVIKNHQEICIICKDFYENKHMVHMGSYKVREFLIEENIIEGE